MYTYVAYLYIYIYIYIRIPYVLHYGTGTTSIWHRENMAPGLERMSHDIGHKVTDVCLLLQKGVRGLGVWG